MVDQLSPRAQEFIAAEQSDGTSLWNQVDLTSSTPEDTNHNLINKDQLSDNICFSATFPWKVSVSHLTQDDSQCRWQGKVISPLTHLVIGKHPRVNELDDEPGVQIRRKSPQIYFETRLSLNTFEQVVLFRTDQEITVFALTDSVLLTLGFAEGGNINQITDEQIHTFLESMVLKETNSVTPIP